MKVLNLQCPHAHSFEGWFASEEDFQNQLARQLIGCPVCGDTAVVKLPSAPRLNLGSAEPPPSTAGSPPGAAPTPDSIHAAMQAAWMRMVRRALANTEDVGERFTEEARRMHYGEAEERSIRGQATLEQAEELLDEGIALVPLPLPDGFKNTLQ